MTDLAGRYAKAESLLPHNMRKLITSAAGIPSWVGDSDTLWYRRQTDIGHEFVWVDAASGSKRPAFDHARLAAALAEVLEIEVSPHALPLSGIAPQGDSVRVTFGPFLIDVALDSYTATIVDQLRPEEALSPDGRWAVSHRDHNLYVRDTATGEERQLTTDGVDGCGYGNGNDQVAMKVMQQNLGFSLAPQLVWSPDSSRFITHRIEQRDVGLMHLVRSSPLTGGRPQLLSYHYSLPGDEHVSTAEYFVIDVASGTSVQAKLPPFDMPFVSHISSGWVWWSQDQSRVYWLSNDRGDHNVALHELDPATGDLQVLVTDCSTSQILYGPQQTDRNVRILSSGEVLWWSQRNDWGHLYLYGTDGSITTLTSGNWGVRHVVLIDEEDRRVVFTAGGHDPDADPYLQQLCSVSLDGGPITAITSDGLDHTVYASPSGRYFIDSVSRWDTPTVAVLRDHTGAVVLGLEESDAAALYATGWTPPERAVVKAADGETDIYCAIYKPHDFDPLSSYPVLDCIYPGPQMSCSPLRFPLSGGPPVTAHMAFNFPEAVAALGFVVVTVDGRGSAMRERSFQDHSRNPASVFVDDHVTAITQLGGTRPWMDVEQVGIYGYSAGGFGSARAFLQAPGFYKVCVSASGNHDNRINHAWWGEKYFGLADDFDFEAQANVTLAENLTGKLLLIHGEMDDNATPHGTMRLVDALITANKDFDLLIIPNADHFMMVHREYFVRRRWDYLVEHLLGETPPSYKLAPIPLEPVL